MDVLRLTLRELLEGLFTTASEFEAFFADHFSTVWRLCGSGMNRSDQITLLLQRRESHQVVRALVQHFGSEPHRLQQIEQRLAAAHSPEAQEEAELNQTILEFSQELELRRTKGLPTEALKQKLIEYKRKRRELRQGLALLPGHELGGRYKLLMQIGKGGFAAVWQAFDYQTRMIVALKVLHSEQASSAEPRERFERGARILRLLNHSNIIRLFENPQEDQGYYYTALEYAPGGDLEAAVLAGELSPGAALGVVLQAADALSFAHSQGLVHRDVKPKNILLDVTGSAKLTDFDLVRAEDSTGGTRTGALGTLLFAAPEQRDDASQVDTRADVYGLGMTAVFAIYGRRLPQQVIEDRGRQTFVASLACPRAIRSILRKAIAADPTSRQQHVAELKEELSRRVSQLSVYAPVGARRTKARALYAVGALAALCCLVTAYALYEDPPIAVPQLLSKGQASLYNASVTKPSQVALYFSLTDSHGEPVPNLAADSFQIYEDSGLLSVFESKQSLLNPEVAAQHYTLLLVDLSGSVSDSGALEQLKPAVQNFVDRIGQVQRVAVYGFDGSEDIFPITDFTEGGSPARAAAEQLGRVRTRDPSANLNGAVIEGLKVLDKALLSAPTPLHFGSLVVFTDGTDHAQRVLRPSLAAALGEAVERDVGVYVIGVGSEIDSDELRNIGRRGSFLTKDPTLLGKAFDTIAQRVEAFTKSFYLLSYCSPARAHEHDVTVKIEHENLNASLTYHFDATGFEPQCDAARLPKFDLPNPIRAASDRRPSSRVRGGGRH